MLVEGVAVFGVAAGGGHGDVEGGASAVSDAGLLGVTGAGVYVLGVAMDADEHGIGVLFEDVLCSVSVVDVPVEDEDAVDVVFVAEVIDGDGGICEHAEAHGAVAFGVVAWRADGAEGVGDVTSDDAVDGFGDAAGGEEGEFVASGTNSAVGGVDVGVAVFAGADEALDVFVGVCPFEGVGVEGSECQAVAFVDETAIGEGFGDPSEAAGAFGVVWTGEVVLEDVVEDESGFCHRLRRGFA